MAIRNGPIIFVFRSDLMPLSPSIACDAERRHPLLVHGDFVEDVSFDVDDLDYVIEVFFNRFFI